MSEDDYDDNDLYQSDSEYETQKNQISELLKTPLKKGDVWYLVDTKWFKQWKKFVGFDSWDTRVMGEDNALPGPIDNAPLFKDGTCELKEHLIDELDYMLVPTEAWEKMVTWYSTVAEQEPIVRKVILQGMFVKQCKVEVYLMDLKFCQNKEMEKVLTKRFSRADTIEHIEKEMKRLFSICEDKEVRLWNKYKSNTYEHLNKPENTLQEAALYQGQMIVVEQQNDDGTWPRQTKSTSAYSSSATTMVMSSTYGTSPVSNAPEETNGDQSSSQPRVMISPSPTQLSQQPEKVTCSSQQPKKVACSKKSGVPTPPQPEVASSLTPGRAAVPSQRQTGKGSGRLPETDETRDLSHRQLQRLVLLEKLKLLRLQQEQVTASFSGPNAK